MHNLTCTFFTPNLTQGYIAFSCKIWQVHFFHLAWKKSTCQIVHEKCNVKLAWKSLLVKFSMKKWTCQNPCVLVNCLHEKKSVQCYNLVYLFQNCVSLVYLSKSLCTCQILQILSSNCSWKSVLFELLREKLTCQKCVVLVNCLHEKVHNAITLFVYLSNFAWNSQKVIYSLVYLSNFAWKSVHVKLCMKKFTCIILHEKVTRPCVLEKFYMKKCTRL